MLQNGNQCTNIIIFNQKVFQFVRNIDCFDCYVVPVHSGQVLCDFFVLFVDWLYWDMLHDNVIVFKLKKLDKCIFLCYNPAWIFFVQFGSD